MTEAEARAWLDARFGEVATSRIAQFLAMVIDENARQNLIAPSTMATIWARHAVDSAQLLAFDQAGETWLDIGSGGGFPGMIVALLRDAPVILVEPRTRRAAFLAHCTRTLNLTSARVVAGKIERWAEPAGIISARAVAPIETLVARARQCAGVGTRWILPKGRTAEQDLADARHALRGVFHVEQSVVEPDAGIVIMEKVEPK